MKFHWTDGHTVEKPVGAQIRGLKHNNRRPRTIEFSAWELLMLAQHPEYAQTIATTMEVVKPEVAS